MQIVRHRMEFRAPVAHNEMGADTGNITQFRRLRMFVGDRVVSVPAISAGALRGVVRRALWREAFDLCGLSRESLPGQWDRLYAALANGGTIEAAETRVVPDMIRARRAAMPLLSLLGAALYEGFVAGRLQTEHSWLACSELETGPVSMHDLMQEVTTVRHVDREEQDPTVSGVTPMPSTVETVIAGSTFIGRSAIAGELEASAWAHGLDLVESVGGKRGQGCGAVAISHDGDSKLYREWLAANRDALRASLVQLAEELSGTKKKAKKEKKKGKAEAEPEAEAEAADEGA